jgi:hypothetical protein
MSDRTFFNPASVILVVGVAILGLAIIGGWLLWGYMWLSVQVAWAEDQTAIVEEMRERALKSGARTAAGCLEYAVRYYPSGTKQTVGSRLDRMVERGRACAIKDILIHLRRVTGDDLGDDPEAWIQKYAKD